MQLSLSLYRSSRGTDAVLYIAKSSMRVADHSSETLRWRRWPSLADVDSC
jgi:hypothetical protein